MRRGALPCLQSQIDDFEIKRFLKHVGFEGNAGVSRFCFSQEVVPYSVCNELATVERPTASHVHYGPSAVGSVMLYRSSRRRTDAVPAADYNLLVVIPYSWYVADDSRRD